MPAARRDRLVVLLVGLVATIAFATIYLPFLPTARGGLGHDYSYFLPQLLAGSYWMEENGPLTVPWFTPAWLGGVPFYPNPQNLYHSLPQQLCAFVDPLTAVRTTFLVFFVVGFSGAYRLARSAFSVSRPAALLCAVLFAFNGYFAHRMLIGHLVYHTVMLQPWIAHWMTRSARSRVHDVRLGALAGAALAYLFHSADLYGLPVAAGLVVAVWAMQRLTSPHGAVPVMRGVVALGTSLALSAAKLVPMAAMLDAFPRTGYSLPGADGVLTSIQLMLVSVFGGAPVEIAHEGIVNTLWAIQRHELEYSLSPVAALAIIQSTWGDIH